MALKGPRIFRMGTKPWLQLQVTMLTPKKRLSLSAEALKPDTVFSFQAMRVLDGTFFQYKVISSTLKICCLGQPPSLLIWLSLLNNLLQLLHQYLLLHLAV